MIIDAVPEYARTQAAFLAEALAVRNALHVPDHVLLGAVLHVQASGSKEKHAAIK